MNDRHDLMRRLDEDGAKRLRAQEELYQTLLELLATYAAQELPDAVDPSQWSAEAVTAALRALKQQLLAGSTRTSLNGHAPVVRGTLEQFGKHDFPMPRTFSSNGHDHEAT